MLLLIDYTIEADIFLQSASMALWVYHHISGVVVLKLFIETTTNWDDS